MRKKFERKTFGRIFANRAFISVLLATVVALVTVFAMYNSFSENVMTDEQNIFQSELNKTCGYSKGLASLRFCMSEDVYESGYKDIGWIEDADTGEILADTSVQPFLFIKENKNFYVGDMSDFKDIPEEYRDYDMYGFELSDCYISDESMLPGKITIFGHEYVDTLDLSPANTEGYTHIEDESGSDFIFLFVGEDYSEDLGSLKSSMDAYADSVMSKDKIPFPGHIEVVTRRRCGEIFGRNLVLYRYCEHNFMHESNAGPVMILIYVLALLISFIFALKEYYENKYLCDIDDYRRGLMDSMAHDLRSPLTVMGGYAQNLAENVNNDKRQYYADSIVKNVDYMDSIITKNLELSRLAAEDIKGNRTDVDFIEKFRKLIEKYEPSLQERNVKVNIEGSFISKVNEVSINSALENVISNAVKYVNNDGVIHIYSEDKSLLISNTTDENFDVKIEELWNPLVKGDKSRSNRKGTGIGLAIAKRVFDMNKLKASLKYDSSNKTFYVIIK